MSDVPIPSYRVRPADDGPPWRMLAIAGGVAAAVAVAAAVGWGLGRMGSGGVPVIEPDSRPIKVRPDDPGGLRVPNQDDLIFDRDRRGQGVPQAGARLAPEPEAPLLDALRRQVAPPPPPVVMPAPQEAASAPQVAVPHSAEPEAPATAAEAPVAQPVAPPAAPAVARPAPVPNGRIQVQLGALPTEEQARTEWDRLSRRMPELLGEFRPQFLRFDRPGQSTMWRIRTGGLADAEAARELCEQVRAHGGACAVVGG